VNADETEILEFLKSFPDRFVASTEVAKRAGNRNRYALDKNWALPILRRMEIEGLVEANEVGEYRSRSAGPSFREALNQAGMDLGETTIITLREAAGTG
jgi:hypothetical protein